ncbi:MAG: hypothetical protein COA85_13690 [Robiginitomaculum sp.]|nr:MAG: hypothetical protein COA85_13690 [Robiginitomaculum sp.]
MKVYFKALASIFASPKQEPEAGRRLRRYIFFAVLFWFAFVIVGCIWLSTADKNFLNLSDIFKYLYGIDIIIALRNAGLAIGTLAAGLLAVITLANSLNRTVQNDETIANERRKSDAEIFARQILETLAAFIRGQSRPYVKAWEAKYTVTVINEETGKETEEFQPPFRDKEGIFNGDIFNNYINDLVKAGAPEDIQTAFKIIVRTFPVKARPELEEGKLNLNNSWLVNIRMPNESYLQQLSFFKTHMEWITLRNAHMKGAFLSGAHMERANLSGANMEEADLTNAHMERASIVATDFNGCNGLNPKQLNSAQWRPELPPINIPKDLLPLPHDGEGNSVKTEADEKKRI